MTSSQAESIRIAKSRDALWELLTTISGIPDWYDNWDTVEHDDTVDQRLRIGARFQLVRHRGELVEWAQCRVVLVDAPHRLRWIEDQLYSPPITVDFRLEPDSAEATVLTLTKTY